jgi:hypothetical protein
VNVLKRIEQAVRRRDELAEAITQAEAKYAQLCDVTSDMGEVIARTNAYVTSVGRLLAISRQALQVLEDEISERQSGPKVCP